MRTFGTVLLCPLLLAGCSSTPEPAFGFSEPISHSITWDFGDRAFSPYGGIGDDHPWTKGLTPSSQFFEGVFLYVGVASTGPQWPVDLPHLVGVIEREDVTHDLDEHGVQMEKVARVREAWFEGSDRAFQIGDSIPDTDWVIEDIFLNRKHTRGEDSTVLTGVELWREVK